MSKSKRPSAEERLCEVRAVLDRAVVDADYAYETGPHWHPKPHPVKCLSETDFSLIYSLTAPPKPKQGKR